MHKTNKEEFVILKDEDIEEMCDWLEFYDKHRYFPFEKKKVILTLSGIAIEKLKKQKNKSHYVDDLILNIR